MAEKLVENQVCENCGADIRLNALFCYNCGSQVASDEDVAAENQNGKKISDAWFKDSIAEAKIAEKAKVADKKTKTKEKETIETEAIETEAIPKPTELLPNDNSAKEIKSQPLKTASSLRNRPSYMQKKKVEVTWESHENAPNLWFLLVTIVLVIFAVSILFAMLYIR